MARYLRRHQWPVLLVLASLWLTFCPAADAMADAVEFDIAAQPMPQALKRFAAQAHVQLLFDYKALEALKTSAIRGRFEATDALALLLRGTGFTFQQVNDHTIAIKAARTTSDAQTTPGPSSDEPQAKEAASGIRVAQVDQGQTASSSTVANQDEQASKKKPVQLEEVVVTGSRIPTAAGEGAQDVKVYTRERIEQSGQTTVSDFLNTLPQVSVASVEGVFNFIGSATTVQLHGLPVGTTLVLINGRRVEANGLQGGLTEGLGNRSFDLNSLPLLAVERIEVISEGSSAIYGSDAIAGVVNIVLKKNFTGFEATGTRGWAADTGESDTGVAWGQSWDRGSISIIGSFLDRSELLGSDRRATASQNFVPYGGFDYRSSGLCNPTTVFTLDGSNLPGAPAGPAPNGSSYSYATVSPNATGNPRLTGFQGTYGQLNTCSSFTDSSVIPATRRAGLFLSGNYSLSASIELFAELAYSHSQELFYLQDTGFYGVPGFSQVTVPASNPFNPFGETVGIGESFPGIRISEITNTTFFRPLLGLRGNLPGKWYWEVAGWDSEDRPNFTYGNTLDVSKAQTALDSTNSATALNPFVAGLPGSPQQLQSLLDNPSNHFLGRTIAANGFVRGPVLELPAGPLELVLGSEYDRDKIGIDAAAYERLNAVFDRNSYAVFGEARVPILAARESAQSQEILTATLAGRYDHYSDFGGKSTPQFGLVWRPSETLLLRGTYGGAFKAPALFDVYAPNTTFPGTVNDPLRGNQSETFLLTTGGNSRLNAESGHSSTIGLVYTSTVVPRLRVSVTQWHITENNDVQLLPIIDLLNNASLFPGTITRAPPSPNGSVGPIVAIDDTYINFGEINVSGFDYQIDYSVHTAVGEVSPTLSVTQTYHYTEALVPGAPPTNRVSVGDFSGFSPRWKGTASLGWKLGPWSANVTGRYVGKYQDYDPGANGQYLTLGNFWFFDVNARYALGTQFAQNNRFLRNAYLEVGAINVLNASPQYSNDGAGYDPIEADLRGRFSYAKIGVKW